MVEVIYENVRTNDAFVRVAVLDGFGDILVEGAGFSRRHPDDKPNKHIGRTLAFSRALDDLSKNIKKMVNFEVGKADNYRRQELSKKRKDSQEVGSDYIDAAIRSMLLRFLEVQ